MLEIKHVREEIFAHRAIQANFIRQSNFTDKFKQRHKRGNYFQVIEKKEIVDVNPEVSVQQLTFSSYSFNPFLYFSLLTFFCKLDIRTNKQSKIGKSTANSTDWTDQERDQYFQIVGDTLTQHQY